MHRVLLGAGRAGQVVAEEGISGFAGFIWADVGNLELLWTEHSFNSAVLLQYSLHLCVIYWPSLEPLLLLSFQVSFVLATSHVFFIYDIKIVTCGELKVQKAPSYYQQTIYLVPAIFSLNKNSFLLQIVSSWRNSQGYPSSSLSMQINQTLLRALHPHQSRDRTFSLNIWGSPETDPLGFSYKARTSPCMTSLDFTTRNHKQRIMLWLEYNQRILSFYRWKKENWDVFFRLRLAFCIDKISLAEHQNHIQQTHTTNMAITLRAH